MPNFTFRTPRRTDRISIETAYERRQLRERIRLRRAEELDLTEEQKEARDLAKLRRVLNGLVHGQVILAFLAAFNAVARFV